MTVHWWCIGSPPNTPACDAAGTYDHTAKTGASGPAHQHTKKSGHATVSAAREWKAA